MPIELTPHALGAVAEAPAAEARFRRLVDVVRGSPTAADPAPAQPRPGRARERVRAEAPLQAGPAPRSGDRVHGQRRPRREPRDDAVPEDPDHPGVQGELQPPRPRDGGGHAARGGHVPPARRRDRRHRGRPPSAPRRRRARAPVAPGRSRTAPRRRLVGEMLLANGISIPQRVATALVYGIQTDTADLARNVSPADERVFAQLYAMADKKILGRIQRARVPEEYFRVPRARAAARPGARRRRDHAPRRDRASRPRRRGGRPPVPPRGHDLVVRDREQRPRALRVDPRRSRPRGSTRAPWRAPSPSPRGSGGGHESMAAAQIPIPAGMDGPTAAAEALDRFLIVRPREEVPHQAPHRPRRRGLRGVLTPWPARTS